MRRLLFSIFATLQVTVAYPASYDLVTTGPIVVGTSITIGGTSAVGAYWGPVLVSGDYDLTDLDPLVPDTTNRVLALSLASSPVKWHHAGFDTPEDSPDVGFDKWLRHQCSGLLISNFGGTRVEAIPRWNTALQTFVTTSYAAGAALSANEAHIGDIFTQTLSNVNGTTGFLNDCFTESLGNGWGVESWQFPSGYMSSSITTATGENIFFPPPDPVLDGYSLGDGAFVQQCTQVKEKVETLLTVGLSYSKWKPLAIQHNWYARPGQTSFVNADGVPLYVNPATRSLVAVAPGDEMPMDSNGNPFAAFTELRQLTMKALVPADGNTAAIADRILFIDTADGTEDGPPANLTLGSNDDFFWKGLFYLQGNLAFGGSGNAPTVRMKNPDQYQQDSTGNSTGYLVGRCTCDGVVYTSGMVDRIGNSTVYGTVVAKGAFGTGSPPFVYYNSRLLSGLDLNNLPVSLSSFEAN